MLIGRKKEFLYLEEIYQLNTNSLAIMYGRSGIGKTSIIQECCKDKTFMYYNAYECSENEHLKLMKNAWLEDYSVDFPHENYSFYDIFINCCKHKGKIVIIIEEFIRLIRYCPTFLMDLKMFFDNPRYQDKFMMILSSSSIQWVENDMVNS